MNNKLREVSLEVNTYLSDLYNQIEYEIKEKYEREIVVLKKCIADLKQASIKEEKKKTLEEEFEEYNKNKNIDKISLHFDEDLSEFLATTSINALDYEEICQGGFENLLIDKINEIIDYLDYLKSKGEE